MCRESTCAGTLLLELALCPLSTPNLVGYPSLAFLLPSAYKLDFLPECQSRRWLFHRQNRHRRHPALLLPSARRSDMWVK